MMTKSLTILLGDVVEIALHCMYCSPLSDNKIDKNDVFAARLFVNRITHKLRNGE